MHICISKVCHHWFRWWIVYPKPSYELLLVYFYWTLENKFQWNLNQNTAIFISGKCFLQNYSHLPRCQCVRHWIGFRKHKCGIRIFHLQLKHEENIFALINSLWPNDMWRQGSRSTLAQVMTCCPMAPSHCLNQCWQMISEVPWHPPDNNFTENTIYRWNEFEIN